ncbi:hypothetical protein LMG8286_01731 [Campylobacter suis]|uniref:Uncharacterized protein n=1 Tax=Campylobacter suis TaxID=2790657 RepID=A0ABN7K9Q4_9BACT|nr:hypothetical protein LMG8286_01731 [Campylobacter suis]
MTEISEKMIMKFFNSLTSAKVSSTSATKTMPQFLSNSGTLIPAYTIFAARFVRTETVSISSDSFVDSLSIKT